MQPIYLLWNHRFLLVNKKSYDFSKAVSSRMGRPGLEILSRSPIEADPDIDIYALSVDGFSEDKIKQLSQEGLNYLVIVGVAEVDADGRLQMNWDALEEYMSKRYQSE